MPNRRKTKSKPKRRGNNSRVLTTLKSIDDAQQTNVRGRVPAVPDTLRIRAKRDKIYTFHKQQSSSVITPSVTLDQLGAFQFDLNSTSDSGSFQALFDCWRIVQVSIEFVPLTTGPYAAPLYTVIDYDDANTPASIASLLEYDTLEITQAGSFLTRTFNPRAAVGVYSSTLFTNFARTTAGQWMDVASPTTKYYALKWGIPALPGGTTTAVYQTVASIVYQFKNTR